MASAPATTSTTDTLDTFAPHIYYIFGSVIIIYFYSVTLAVLQLNVCVKLGLEPMTFAGGKGKVGLPDH